MANPASNPMGVPNAAARMPIVKEQPYNGPPRAGRTYFMDEPDPFGEDDTSMVTDLDSPET